MLGLGAGSGSGSWTLYFIYRTWFSLSLVQGRQSGGHTLDRLGPSPGLSPQAFIGKATVTVQQSQPGGSLEEARRGECRASREAGLAAAKPLRA